MAKALLTIQHDNTLFEPPVEGGVKIEWERTGVPGKLTFTTVGVSNASFTEGDPVCFYYDDKPVFMGYVFTKKHDKDNKISVTCYDQLRYLKNKFTYVFEKKTATQIIQALCKDFDLHTGTMDNTNYVIPSIAEENKSAFDIILDVLEETLVNTGDMFVLYDDFGELKVKNSANMVSTTLIYNDTAENFDFSSSIDSETYNQVVLYYKQNDSITQMYTAQSPTTIKQWGTLRYFEEVKTPSIGQNKANSLLKLYNKKTRELKITGAFGDVSVRGGTLIPVKLDFGEVLANNYMLVDKVTHTFDSDHYTMDLTLVGSWGDKTTDMVSKTIGKLTEEKKDDGDGKKKNTTTTTDDTTETVQLTIIQSGQKSTATELSSSDKRGSILVKYKLNGLLKSKALNKTTKNTIIEIDKDSGVTMEITPGRYRGSVFENFQYREYHYSVHPNEWALQPLRNGRAAYTKVIRSEYVVDVIWKSTYDKVDSFYD